MTWTLKKQLEQRLAEMQEEYDSGQKFLAELEVRQTNVKETLLRIAGAIQVLEEELKKASTAEQNGGQPVNGTGRSPISSADTRIPAN